MNHASLFTGIGGFDLAAEWMGWNNIFQCEKDDFCQKLLQQNFPQTFKIKDIHDLTVDNHGNILNLDGKNIVTMGRNKSTKYDYAVDLYQSGMSIGDCADFYEISRQAMYTILDRRGCVFRDQLKFGQDNHFHRGCLPDRSKKERAHNIVEKAVLYGRIFRPANCEQCGSGSVFKDGRSGIQAHHDDYDKPLSVRWLCQQCHHEWHSNNKAINETDLEKQMEPSGTIDVLTGGFP